MSDSFKRSIGPIDAAILISVTTAILFFWGYVYFVVFCEQLHFSFYGIEVPQRDYLIPGWPNVFAVTLTIVTLLGVGAIAGFFIDEFVARKGKKRKVNSIDSMETTSDFVWYSKVAALLVYIAFFAITGGQHSMESAKRDAANVSKNPRLVVVRDKAGKELDGYYVMLRNFGGALVVDELSPDKRRIVAVRIILKGSYSSYSVGEYLGIVPIDPWAAPQPATQPPPAAQSPNRTDCGCLGTIGTWFASLVALSIALSPCIRRWYRRPVLSVDPSRIDEFSSEIEGNYWLRVPIQNAPGKLQAKNVEVFLEKLEEVTAQGLQAIEGVVPMRIKWSNTSEPFCSNIPSGGFRLLDIARLGVEAAANIKDGDMVIEFPLLILGGEVEVDAHATLRYGTYRLTLTMSAEDLRPIPLKLDIHVRSGKTKLEPLARVQVVK